MKNFYFTLLFLLIFSLRSLTAGEGMWIPMLLQQMNEQEMKAMGMRISAEDIYSINRSSMKDAIVQFGRGCTAEIVSTKGLLLTNHHCGYGEIQKHSTLENDYLTNGFWAMNLSEELPNPGLTVTMLVKMEEVTEQILTGVSDDLTEARRAAIIRENTRKLTAEAAKESGLEVFIRAFYHGNQYFIVYNKVFKDIRLVGAPPSNIGKFGGDTDNWMWPRHTGDFAVFRIYVDPNGNPAEYHPDNVPYQPDYHLPISLKGVEEGDFTFVFGYPGRTSQYLPASAVQLITEKSNPHRVQLRETRLEIFKQYSASDPQIRLQYATKDARVANAWKKMIGESKGIKRLNGISRKQELENQFNAWAKSNPQLAQRYGGILEAFNNNYTAIEPFTLANDYINEAGLGIEIIQWAARFRPLIEESIKNKPDQQKIQSITKDLISQSELHFKDYNLQVDRDVAAALLRLYIKNQPDNFRPDFLNSINSRFKGNIDAYVERLFGKSIFANPAALTELLSNYTPAKAKRIQSDPAYQAFASMRSFAESSLLLPLRALNAANDSLQRIYMKGLMEMQSDKRFYPDANSTLRVTYGKVEGYSPADAVYYQHYTTLEGIMEKEDPDVYDYVVDEKLKALFKQKDFGEYGSADGTVRVAFAASNHTTGGNSGSPILNADGHMVGINFDRCWEGTMSDLMYDPAMSRNISVDIRYVLFVIDKLAGARHLVDEMTIIR